MAFRESAACRALVPAKTFSPMRRYFLMIVPERHFTAAVRRMLYTFRCTLLSIVCFTHSYQTWVFKAPNGMLWIEAVPELEAAKARVATLMQTMPCEYLIFSQKTGRKISINPTDVYGNSQPTCVARPFIRRGLCHTPVERLLLWRLRQEPVGTGNGDHL